MDTRITHLFDLGADNIKSDIAEKMGPSGIIQFAETCKYSFGLFQHEYGVARKTLYNLLVHIIRGQQSEAEEILRQDPFLLNCHGTVVDYSGRSIVDVTPLQLAYGADDIEMCHMLTLYINDIPEGWQTSLSQINQKFDDGDIHKNEYDFSALVKAITSNMKIEDVLNDFREDFIPRLVISGKHFNIEILVKSLDIYNENYHHWQPDQRSLFWSQVIGYLQRFVPACYAQAFCQGLNNIIDDQSSLIRSFKLDNGNKYYPLDMNEHTRLGFDFAVYSGGIPFSIGIGSLRSREAFSSYLRLYVKRNHEALVALRRNIELNFKSIETHSDHKNKR